MKNWFKVKVSYRSINDNGKEVKVSESYLIDAFSFTECESRITTEISKIISGEFEISAIQKKNYSEVIKANWSINMVDAEANKLLGTNKSQTTEADKWFDCKVVFISYDEMAKVEKKTSTSVLVHANSVNSAHDTLMQAFTGMVSDFEIEKVGDSKIIDVFIYSDK